MQYLPLQPLPSHSFFSSLPPLPSPTCSLLPSCFPFPSPFLSFLPLPLPLPLLLSPPLSASPLLPLVHDSILGHEKSIHNAPSLFLVCVIAMLQGWLKYCPTLCYSIVSTVGASVWPYQCQGPVQKRSSLSQPKESWWCNNWTAES